MASGKSDLDIVVFCGRRLASSGRRKRGSVYKGAVDYEYGMGKYQVTIDQFVKANAGLPFAYPKRRKSDLQEYENLDKRSLP